ncbi:MAG: hypothetical protein SFV17_12610 [Candidatus Obscuribacter sp.]|nr:hypothetical protein [Candidatus Melainabacteria bacterium]MDX1987522.1 hypothetical protein [Candidatus Obscuribacter sp.]
MSRTSDKNADNRASWQAVDQGTATKQDIDAIYNSIWNERAPKSGADLTGMERMQYDRQSSAGTAVKDADNCRKGNDSACDKKHLPPVDMVPGDKPCPPGQDMRGNRQGDDGCFGAERAAQHAIRSAREARQAAREADCAADAAERAAQRAIKAAHACTIGEGPYKAFCAPNYYEGQKDFCSTPKYEIWNKDERRYEPWDPRQHNKGGEYRTLPWNPNQGGEFKTLPYDPSQPGEMKNVGWGRAEQTMKPETLDKRPREDAREALEKRTQKVCYPDGSSRVVLRNDQGEIIAVVNPDGSRLERTASEPGKGHTWKAYGRHGTPITADSFRGEVQMSEDGTFRMVKVYPVPQTYEQKPDGSYRHAYRGGAREQWTQSSQAMAVLYPDGKRRTIQYAPDRDGILRETKVTNA